MTPSDRTADPRLLADEVFEAGSRQADIRSALEHLGDGRQAFLDRLALRAVLDRSHSSKPVEEDVPASVLASLRNTYVESRVMSKLASGATDLSTPAPWMAAKAAFGDDREFIVKLARRQVTAPSANFLRYAADALGVAIDQVRRFFLESGIQPRLVAAEFKSSSKPIGEAVEDFEVAVRAAKVPEDLKARWLGE